MRRLKTTDVAVALAVTALAALGGGAATASAAGSWYVNETKLATTTTTATTAGIDEPTSFVVPTFDIKVTCTGGSGKVAEYGKPKINPSDTWEAEWVEFEGCSESEPTGCSVESDIVTEPLEGLLETGASPVDKIRFAPKHHVLATVDFFGASCTLAGEKPVTGRVVVDLRGGQLEGTTQLLEPLGTVENSSFEVADSRIYVEQGKALLKLASSSKWSFH